MTTELMLVANQVALLHLLAQTDWCDQPQIHQVAVRMTLVH